MNLDTEKKYSQDDIAQAGAEAVKELSLEAVKEGSLETSLAIALLGGAVVAKLLSMFEEPQGGTENDDSTTSE